MRYFKEQSVGGKEVFLCDKCGKSFDREDDENIYDEGRAEGRPMFVPLPPGYGTDIYDSRGVVVGSVVAVIGQVIDENLPYTYEVIPRMIGMNAMMSCVVARMKITIPTTIKRANGDRVFRSQRYAYVLVDRATHEPVSR